VQRSVKDVLAGLVFVGFGLAFAAGATTYAIGSAARMGPGFYPLIVGVLLVVLGAVIVGRSLREADAEPLSAPAWRAVALIVGAVMIFGLTARGLGLAPSIFITAALSSLASQRTSIPVALGFGLLLSALCVAIFVSALRLNLQLLGPWIPRF
jgi:hypothetical protein